MKPSSREMIRKTINNLIISLERNERGVKAKSKKTSSGQTLKRLRHDNKLTLQKMSKLSGVEIATLSRMEADKMTGSLESYRAIAEAYGMSLSQLIQEIEKN